MPAEVETGGLFLQVGPFSRWFFAALSFAPSYGEIPQMKSENKSRAVSYRM